MSQFLWLCSSLMTIEESYTHTHTRKLLTKRSKRFFSFLRLRHLHSVISPFAQAVVTWWAMAAEVRAWRNAASLISVQQSLKDLSQIFNLALAHLFVKAPWPEDHFSLRVKLSPATTCKTFKSGGILLNDLPEVMAREHAGLFSTLPLIIFYDNRVNTRIVR